MKKLFVVSLSVLIVMGMLAGCKKNTPDEPEVPTVKDIPVQHELEFGGVYITVTIDDFNAQGFAYGDSVKIEFSNGYTMVDIPYYNGYYVDAGEPLLIAYPGYDYIKAAINYGADLWEQAGLLGRAPAKLWATAGLDEHSTATVTLLEKGKYLDIQEARDIHYKDDRSEFPSDEAFANFRPMNLGNMKDNTVYRSASPCDNQHNRAPYVNDLIERAGVNCILNLADNDVKIGRYISADDFNSPYFLTLYNEGKVIPLALNMNYFSEEFKSTIARGFAAMAEMDGPYLVHCTEGKDRTGFVCMLIEALAGTSYQDMVDDYMLTYDNYYKITEQSDKAKYDVILDKNLVSMIRSVVNDDSVDITKADLVPYVEKFLLDAGMTEQQLEAFKAKILK